MIKIVGQNFAVHFNKRLFGTPLASFKNVALKQNFYQDLYTAQKMKISTKDFFSKCDQIYCLLQIWSHILKMSVMENFIFLCSVITQEYQQKTPPYGFSKKVLENLKKKIRQKVVLNTTIFSSLILIFFLKKKILNYLTFSCQKKTANISR